MSIATLETHTADVCTGAGYGPVTLTVPFPITGESLAAYARDNGRDDVFVMAYAPNAGHPLDAHHESVIMGELGDHAGAWTQGSWLTPIRYVYVSADDAEGCEIAADLLARMFDYPILDEDTWSEVEYTEAYEYAMSECKYAGLSDAQAGTVWREVMDSDEPYYTDNSGVCVPSLADAIAARAEV